jgi:hypothetical protein
MIDNRQVSEIWSGDFLHVTNKLTSTVVAETADSTPLIPKPAFGHDPEPVPSTFDSHKLSR